MMESELGDGRENVLGAHLPKHPEHPLPESEIEEQRHGRHI